jgi:hypothetical protein
MMNLVSESGVLLLLHFAVAVAVAWFRQRDRDVRTDSEKSSVPRVNSGRCRIADVMLSPGSKARAEVDAKVGKVCPSIRDITYLVGVPTASIINRRSSRNGTN